METHTYREHPTDKYINDVKMGYGLPDSTAMIKDVWNLICHKEEDTEILNCCVQLILTCFQTDCHYNRLICNS